MKPKDELFMTGLERLLTLDAALIACEGCGHSKFKAAAQQLLTELDELLSPNLLPNIGDNFDLYLKAQHQAVLKLAKCPEVFGYEVEDDNARS